MSEECQVSDPAFVFPFHVGPGVRSFTTPLLYSGGLVVTAPGYTGEPERVLFGPLYDRAEATNHPLLRFLQGVLHHVRLAQKQGLAEIEALRPLGGRIRKTLAYYPGTREAYRSWEPLHGECLGLALASLNNVQALNAASVEFMWRAYEYSLEFNGDLDAVLSEFMKRAEWLGSVDLLIAECALNRHYLAAVEGRRLATTIPETIPLMARVGAKVAADVGAPQVPPEASARQVAFLLFDEVLGPHVPPLHGGNVERVGEWLQARQPELARMKRRCQDEAMRLVACASDLREGRALFRDAVAAMESEVSELLRADRRQAKALVRALTESDSAWVAVAAALNSALDSNPLAAASWGMGALAVLGTSALRVARERAAEIASSPWSFIYYVRQR